MADAKIINYGQPIGAGSTAIPDNTTVALDIESTDGANYVTINTTDGGSEELVLRGGGSAGVKITQNNQVRSTVGDGWVFLTSDPTGTVPNICPSQHDLNTGIGHGAGGNSDSDQLSLIAGGVEGVRITEDTTILAEIKGRTVITADTSGTPDDLGDYDNYALVLQGSSNTNDETALLLSSSGDTYGGSAIVHKDTGAGGKGELNFYTKQGTAAEPPVKAMTLGDTGRVTATSSAVVKGKASFVLTGSIDVTGTNVNVPGTGTKFLSELAIGDAILVTGETRTIATITNDTTATVTAAWGSDLANDTSPECNPAAFTVIRDTGDLGMVLDDNGLVGLGEVPSAYWASADDFVMGSGSSSGMTVVAATTGTLSFATSASGSAAYQNVIQGTGSGSGDGIRFITNGTSTECIRITTAGDILCPQLDAGTDVQTDGNKNLTTSSDMRLKNPIAELEAGLDKINQLVPRFFSWKNDEDNKSQLGFFSQEVHSICPEAAPKSPKMVTPESGVDEDGVNACDKETVQALDDDGNLDFNWGLNSRAIVALLVKSVQELSAKVTELEAGD